MNEIDRGSKHICPECATKYYDLRKKVVTCPKCGAEPPVPKVPKARKPATPAAKTGRTAFWRYP